MTRERVHMCLCACAKACIFHTHATRGVTEDQVLWPLWTVWPWAGKAVPGEACPGPRLSQVQGAWGSCRAKPARQVPLPPGTRPPQVPRYRQGGQEVLSRLAWLWPWSRPCPQHTLRCAVSVASSEDRGRSSR